MAVLGADPEQLRALGLSLRRAADQLDQQSIGLERRVRAAGWRGPDAERFEHEWQLRHRASMRTVADSCRTSATTLVRQAGEQEQASSGTGATGSSQFAGSTAQGRTADPHTSTALPTSETRVHVGGEVVGTLLMGAAAHDVSIQQLADGRARVTVGDTDRAGVAVSTGSPITVSGSEPVAGSTAQAEATIGRLTRRSYVVDPGDVPSTLVRAEAERTGERGIDAVTLANPAIGLTLDAANGVQNWLLDHVGVHDGLGGLAESVGLVLAAERVETLAQIQIGAAAAASLNGPVDLHGSAALEGVARYGTARLADGSTSKIVEIEQSASGSLNSTMLHGLGLDEHVADGDREPRGSLRLEIPDDRSGGSGSRSQPVTLTMIDSDGEVEHQTVVSIATDGAVGASNARIGREVVAALARGDADQAIRGLTGLQAPAGSSLVSVSAMAITDHRGEVGGGTAVSAAVDGDWQTLRPIKGSGD